MADGDDVDDDFVPFPPSANTRSKDVGRCSAADSKDAGDGSSQRLPTPDGSNTAKLNRKAKGKRGKEGRMLARRSKNQGYGYCATCKREYTSISQHLKWKLSAPVFECSHCIYKAKDRHRILSHTKARVCGRGAKIVRIRAKTDVAREMRQLRETHCGFVPRALPYRCKECKVAVGGHSAVSYHILKHHLKLDNYVCPVCGLSGCRSTIQKHMREKHRLCTIRPIFNQAKYRTQIDAMTKAVIVRN